MIPKEYEGILLGKNIAHFATVNPDGSPQVTPVWIDYDTETKLISINTARGRKKSRNIKTGSKVAISITESDNLYRYLAIQGKVINITEEGAKEHIDKLAKKYFGREKFGLPEGQIRLKYEIEVLHVFTSG